MAKESAVYVRHMMEAIANIELDVAGYDFERFRNDRRVRQLVERNLEIISEASRRLPAQLKAKESQIDWAAIAGIGNVLRHDYHQGHPTVLWETCSKDLEPLQLALGRMLKELAHRGGAR